MIEDIKKPNKKNIKIIKKITIVIMVILLLALVYTLIKPPTTIVNYLGERGFKIRDGDLISEAIWGVGNFENSTTMHTSSSSAAQTTRFGIRFKPINSVKLINATRWTGVACTTAYLYNRTGVGAGNILSTKTFLGDTATFNFDLIAGNEYFLVCDDGGGSYTSHWQNGFTFPSTSGNATLLSRVQIGVDESTANSRNFRMFVTSSVIGEITLNSPEDNFPSILNEIEFNCSGKLSGGATIVNASLLTNETGTWAVRNITTGLSTSGENVTWNRTFNDGDIFDWTCKFSDSDGDEGFSLTNRTASVDISAPLITINDPIGIKDFGRIGGNETLNWTITDINLDSCWLEYNESNTTFDCLSGITNNTKFILTNQLNLTVYANDSAGFISSNFTNWSYIFFNTNQSFDNLTFSGAEEIFTLDFLLHPSVSISDAFMEYNFTNYTSSIVFLGGEYRLMNTINVPTVNEDTNFSFKFYINANGQLFSSDSFEQKVVQINMTNCSGGGTLVLNLSLFDERLKTNITGDIEINVQAIGKEALTLAGSSNFSFSNVTSGGVCISPLEALSGLYLDAEIKYSSNGYATELYYIQRSDLSTFPINLSLFDLLLNESTEFLLTYQDDNLIFVEGAIIQLQRKYISEDLFEVVEAPLTSDSGTAIVHIDLDTNKYKITIVKDGEVLDTFDNLVFSCESELSGQCTQKLLGQIDPQNDVPIEDLTDFSYEISQSNDTITTAFSIPSGTPTSVNILLVQTDQFNNTEVCNQTIFSSAGSVDCPIIPTIGDSFLDLSIKKSEELQAQKSYIVQEDLSLSFLGNNYWILFILMLSVVGMAFTSPEWIIVNGVITMVIAGALYLANGLNFVVGLGNIIWLIIAAVILIIKISQQEDR